MIEEKDLEEELLINEIDKILPAYLNTVLKEMYCAIPSENIVIARQLFCTSNELLYVFFFR